MVGDESSEGITPTEATLNATINPGEGETVYVFEYGADTSYGSATPVSPSIGNDTADHPVSSTLTGLTPGTTYHYRVVAINFAGTGARGRSDLHHAGRAQDRLQRLRRRSPAPRLT